MGVAAPVRGGGVAELVGAGEHQPLPGRGSGLVGDGDGAYDVAVQVHELEFEGSGFVGGDGEVAFDAGDVAGDVRGQGGVFGDPGRFVGVGGVVGDLGHR